MVLCSTTQFNKDFMQNAVQHQVESAEREINETWLITFKDTELISCNCFLQQA